MLVFQLLEVMFRIILIEIMSCYCITFRNYEVLASCSGCFCLFALSQSSKHKISEIKFCCSLFFFATNLILDFSVLFFFSRSGGNGPDVYKGKICSLKARVRQSLKVTLFTLNIYVQLCENSHEVLKIAYRFKYGFEQ